MIQEQRLGVEADPLHFSFYVSKESKATGGRACIVPTGGVLGGGSSINFLMHTNGCKCRRFGSDAAN